MNVALIHDKYSIKNFWKQKIENHCQMTEDEKSRMKNSALTKQSNISQERNNIKSVQMGRTAEENSFRGEKASQRVDQ
ncbi:hypothetical protein AAFF_G00316890 [Aldrovandia affinis]|uniref:Uncharacterized protein n=1 Tax=Aldrovandia affinis TaxID=143900 RepID=A0AAD7SNC1_9TELE|nr:hypothetical protein AAFF_G00316890 [Aldrovandia affinis]